MFSSFRSLFTFSKHGLMLFVLFGCLGALSSCDLAANYTKADRASNMEIQDFRDGLAERLPETDEKTPEKRASIPEIQPYISTSSASMKAMPLVSVSVNQSVPLRDILYELAQQAEYDLELDPNIRGSIIFTAREKPFDVVIDRISKIAGLRYKFEDGFLRVELDTPYNKTYKIDYLSFIRSQQGAVNTSVSVVSSGDESSGVGSGSTYTSSSDSTSDFWGELELNLTQILGGQSTGALKTRRDPRVTAVEQNPEVAAVAPTQGENGDVSVEPPEAVLRVESLPVDDVDDTASVSSNEDGNGFTFSLNKQAGLVNVYATERAHAEIQKYLTDLRRSVTSQVLVEAKVFEVSLYDEYINGVEWSGVFKSLGFSLLNPEAGPFLNGLTAPAGTIATDYNFGFSSNTSDFDMFIEAISGFGTVRALASPRLTVLNNQSAVLNVATNRVFFEMDLTRETDDDTGDVTLEIDTDIKSIPEGVLINVQPSINLDDRTISMMIRPTVTRIVNNKQDPAVQFVAGDSGLVSNIPEVNVQEIDTVVKVNSGQPIVMGGLLQDRIDDTRQGVPVLGEVPMLGALFHSQDDLVSKTELVIFLKATLVESAGDTIHNTDRDLYRTFSGDRRPFEL